MDLWWCAVGSEPHGPISIDQMRQLLRRRQIDRTTLVWREGMEQWEELHNAADLAAVLLAPPPFSTTRSEGDKPHSPFRSNSSVAYQTESSPSSSLECIGVDPRNTPFRRFCARFIDLNIAAFALGATLLPALSIFAPSLDAELQNTPNANAAILWMLIFAPLVDTLIFRVAGQTAGKAIFGIRVSAKFGKPLSWSSYLARNYRVYWFGLAGLLPILSLFTVLYQARLLRTLGTTAYDIDRYAVSVKPIARWRYAAGVVTFVLIISVNFYFAIAERVLNS